MNGFAMRTHFWLPRGPEDAQHRTPVLPFCPCVVGGIYQPSHIHSNHAKQTKTEDAVLPVAAAAARFRCRCLCSKQRETNKSTPAL